MFTLSAGPILIDYIMTNFKICGQFEVVSIWVYLESIMESLYSFHSNCSSSIS